MCIDCFMLSYRFFVPFCHIIFVALFWCGLGVLKTFSCLFAEGNCFSPTKRGICNNILLHLGTQNGLKRDPLDCFDNLYRKSQYLNIMKSLALNLLCETCFAHRLGLHFTMQRPFGAANRPPLPRPCI